MADLVYRQGETFMRDGYQVEITRDVPWSGWPLWGDMLIDGKPSRSGGGNMGWLFDDIRARAKARRKAV